MTEEHQIPWGLPGPTDPVDRAGATGIERDGDDYTLVKPIQWSNEGIPDFDPGPQDDQA